MPIFSMIFAAAAILLAPPAEAIGAAGRTAASMVKKVPRIIQPPPMRVPKLSPRDMQVLRQGLPEPGYSALNLPDIDSVLRRGSRPSERLDCEARMLELLPGKQREVYERNRRGMNGPEIARELYGDDSSKSQSAARNALYHARQKVFEQCVCREATISAVLRNTRPGDRMVVFEFRRDGRDATEIARQTGQHLTNVTTMVMDFDRAIRMSCECVPKTIHQLPKMQRTVARLTRMEGLDVHRIARKLKVLSVDEVRESLKKVRLRLQEACDETVALVPGAV